MAGTDGRQSPDLKKRLLDEGRRFTFIQAYRLLRYLIRRKAAEADVQECDVQRRIRVRPDLSLAFPKTDIVSIQEISDDQESFFVTATFLGLYGTSSPLPTFYTEDLLLERSQDRSISRDFIDIFNARLYCLHFKSWSRYRLFSKLVEEPDRNTIQRLYCILGLGGETLREGVENPHDKLRYTGLMAQLPRSAAGLRTMLADVLDDPSVRILQCVERIMEIPREQQFALGLSGNTMGEDAYLGSEIPELLGKFRVCVGPLNREDFNRYLPDKPAFRQLDAYIRFYLDQPLVWDLEAAFIPEEAATTKLGEESRCRLGWNTWIFSDGFVPVDASVRFSDRRMYG